jgi:hypothetical protein
MNDKFDTISGFMTGTMIDVYSYMTMSNSGLLVIWLDEQNIFYYPIDTPECTEDIILAINPFCGFLKNIKIKEWFCSIGSWKICRELNIESAIALGLKNVDDDYTIKYSFNYKGRSRKVDVEVGEGIIEMKKVEEDYNEYIYCFNEINSKEWAGIALNGLSNQLKIFSGKTVDRLLLDYLGLDIKDCRKNLVEYDTTIPTKKIIYFFSSEKSEKNKIELKLGDGSSNDLTLKIDINWHKIKYCDAINKSKSFFVCNYEGVLLEEAPLSYNEVSEDGNYYLFNKLGKSYIPKEWLYLQDFDGNMITDKNSNINYLRVVIDIDANKKIIITANGSNVFRN